MTLTKDELTGSLKISGTLDIDNANALREALLDGFSLRPELTLDLGAVEACDASALQVLLAGERHSATGGKALRIATVPACIQKTAAIFGLALPWMQSETETNVDKESCDGV
jgi:anti-anti-sigma factor